MMILVSYSSHSARRKRLKVKKTKISLPNTLHALHLRFETKGMVLNDQLLTRVVEIYYHFVSGVLLVEFLCELFLVEIRLNVD